MTSCILLLLQRSGYEHISSETAGVSVLQRIQYNTIQFAYLPCASWSTAFPLNGFSNFVINSPCSHHLQGSLKHMYIPVFSKLFFILNSISVFCAFDVEFDKSRAYACSTNIKDKNRL